MERLERIWSEHEGQTRRLLVRLSKDPEAAEDLLQETYLRAQRGFSGYRGGDARAWLSAIARNVFLSYATRRARREQPLEEALAGSSGISDELLTALEMRRVVGELPRPLRAALVMRYYGELSYREIAAHLGCPVGTAKWRVHRALALLQAAFGVSREEAIAMASPPVKEEVLAQLQLPRLRFSVQPGNCSPEVAEALQVTVTEVYGTSPRIRDGANYLVCGRYHMTRPIVDSMVMSAAGKASGYHAFVSPGEGAFELYAHIIETAPGPRHTLTIIIFPEGVECWVAHVVLEQG